MVSLYATALNLIKQCSTRIDNHIDTVLTRYYADSKSGVSKLTAQEFMANNKPRKPKSKIDAWATDVWMLLENGFSQRDIIRFLAVNEVEISPTALSAWIRRRNSVATTPKDSEANLDQTAMPTDPMAEQNALSHRSQNKKSYQSSDEITAAYNLQAEKTLPPEKTAFGYVPEDRINRSDFDRYRKKEIEK